MERLPKTLVEAVRYFGDEDRAVAFLAQKRWGNTPCCPRCGSVAVKYIKTRRLWQCKDCETKKQFSVKVGTIFEDCKLPVGSCLIALWMIVNAKNGISSAEIARSLGVTQKTGWFLSHRIRLALHIGSFDRKFLGRVEADETYIGGAMRNMKYTNWRKAKGRSHAGKTIVLGLLERQSGGTVRTIVVPNTKRHTMKPVIDQHVSKHTNLITDAHKSYLGMDQTYLHEFVDHAVTYAEGHVHTNGLENFWSLLKRSITGTYVAVEPFHLFRYLDEQTFRYNHRKATDGERFLSAAATTGGKRLTYKVLTGESAPASA